MPAGVSESGRLVDRSCRTAPWHRPATSPWVVSGYLREPSALPEGEAHSVMGRYRAGDWSWLRWAKGVLSFTIVDGRNGRCVLAVDRLGMRPLYFSQDATGIAFGEDLAAVTARRDGKLELDYDTLQEIMTLGFPLSTPTFVRNVERVGPGIWIEFSAGRRRATRYWSLVALPPMRNQDLSVFLDESQARVREVLRLARRAVPVELRLRFALPIARGTRLGAQSDAVTAIWPYQALDRTTIEPATTGELCRRLDLLPKVLDRWGREFAAG
jgi:hypothetical protein